MRRLQKSKRVSWASDLDLCQETKSKTSATSNMGWPSHSDIFSRCTAGAIRGKGDRFLVGQPMNSDNTFQSVIV